MTVEFNYNEFIELAEHLNKNNIYPLTEACDRTVASRCYYGTLLGIRKIILKQLDASHNDYTSCVRYLNSNKNSSIHKLVRKLLEDINKPQLAGPFLILQEKRVCADYNTNKFQKSVDDELPNLAKKLLERANTIIPSVDPNVLRKKIADAMANSQHK